MSLVEIEGIDKSFGPLKVLDGVTLEVAEGEIVAIIGRSGSGKSTLLRCINGLEPIQGGAIRVDGDLVSAPKADLRRLRQKVGIVFQSYNLFPHLTVERNITLAPTVVKRIELGEAQAIAHQVLARGRPRGQARTPIRISSRAASSNGSPSPARSPCTPRSCCSTRSPRHSIRS